MSPELFSGMLVTILAVVVVANIAWNKVNQDKRLDNPSIRTDEQKAIDSYLDDDSSSRFIRELDLIPFKILSDELNTTPKRQRKNRG